MDLTSLLGHHALNNIPIQNKKSSSNSEHFEKCENALERVTNLAIGKLRRIKPTNEAPSSLAFYCYPCYFSAKKLKKWKSHTRNGVHDSKTSKFNNCQVYKCDCGILIFSNETFYAAHLRSSSHSALMKAHSEKLNNEQDKIKEKTAVISGLVPHDFNGISNSMHCKSLNSEPGKKKEKSPKKCKITNKIKKTNEDKIQKAIEKEQKNLQILLLRLREEFQKDVLAALIKTIFYCIPCRATGKYDLHWNEHLGKTSHKKKCVDKLYKERHCDCRIIVFGDLESYAEHRQSPFHRDLIAEISKYPVVSRLLLVTDSIPIYSNCFKQRSIKALEYFSREICTEITRSIWVLNENLFALGFFCYQCLYSTFHEIQWIKHFSRTDHNIGIAAFPDCLTFRCSCQIVIYGNKTIIARHLYSSFHSWLMSTILRFVPDFKKSCEIFDDPLCGSQCETTSKTFGNIIPSLVPVNSDVPSELKHFNNGCCSLNNLAFTIGTMIKENSLVNMENFVIGFFCYPCLYQVMNEEAWNKHFKDIKHVIESSKFLACQQFACACRILIYGDEKLFNDHLNSSTHSTLLSVLAGHKRDLKSSEVLNNTAVQQCLKDNEELKPGESLTVNSIDHKYDKNISKTDDILKKFFNLICSGLRTNALSTVLQATFWYYCHPCGDRSLSLKKWKSHMRTTVHRKNCMNMSCDERHCDCQIVYFSDADAYHNHLHSKFHEELKAELTKYPLIAEYLLLADSSISISSQHHRRGCQLLNNLTYEIAMLKEDVFVLNKCALTLGFFCYPCLRTGRYDDDWNKHFSGTDHKIQTATFPNCFAILCSCKILIYGDKILFAKHLHSKTHALLMLSLSRYLPCFKGRCEIFNNSLTRISCKSNSKELNILKSEIVSGLFVYHQYSEKAADRNSSQNSDEFIERKIKNSIKKRPEKIIGLSACLSHHMENHHKTKDIVIQPWSRIIRKQENLQFSGCRSNLFYLEHDVMDHRTPKLKARSKKDESRKKKRRPLKKLLRETQMLGISVNSSLTHMKTVKESQLSSQKVKTAHAIAKNLDLKSKKLSPKDNRQQVKSAHAIGRNLVLRNKKLSPKDNWQQVKSVHAIGKNQVLKNRKTLMVLKL